MARDYTPRVYPWRIHRSPLVGAAEHAITATTPLIPCLRQRFWTRPDGSLSPQILRSHRPPRAFATASPAVGRAAGRARTAGLEPGLRGARLALRIPAAGLLPSPRRIPRG